MKKIVGENPAVDVRPHKTKTEVRRVVPWK
jgi:hypothetical protein